MVVEKKLQKTKKLDEFMKLLENEGYFDDVEEDDLIEIFDGHDELEEIIKEVLRGEKSPYFDSLYNKMKREIVEVTLRNGKLDISLDVWKRDDDSAVGLGIVIDTKTGNVEIEEVV